MNIRDREHSLSAAELVAAVRRELAARHGQPRTEHDRATHEVAEARELLPRAESGGTVAPTRPPASLAELVAFDDAAFVELAYRSVLGRGPDAHGREHFLANLRNGSASKVDVLAQLCGSAEARNRRIRIRGLGRAHLLERATRIPVLGAFIAVALALWRLPVSMRGVQRLSAQTERTRAELTESHNAAMAELERRERDTRTAIDAHARILAAQRLVADELGTGLALVHDLARELEARAERVERTGAGFDALKASVDAYARTTRELAEPLGAEVRAVAARLATLERLAEGFDAASVMTHLASLRERIEAIGAQKADRAAVDANVANVARVDNLLAGVAGRVGILEAARVEPAVLAAASAGVAEARTRLGAIEDAIARLGGELAAHRRNLLALQRPRTKGDGRRVDTGADEVALTALDVFYAAFEDRFRGVRSEILQRVRVYLPLIERVAAGLPDAPILDLGCGRGEWLELLRNEGRVATGVDSNGVFVEECRAFGLAVEQADALKFLRSQPDDSYGAVSAMHVVEHLPFESLITLVDECLRVLRPGGLLILETPNPENLTVATQSFHLDPTHRKPLPPPLLAFVVEARGFVRTETWRLESHRGFAPPSPLPADVSGADRINVVVEMLRAAPDYAIVAFKT